MDKRILVGCIAALGTMLGFDLLAQVSGWRLDLPISTPLGTLPIGNLVITFVAMAVGGWIARHRFRWIAVALTALVWVTTIIALVAITPPTSVGATMSLPGIVQFNALAIVLALLASWLGAMFGEQLAARRARPIST